MQTKQKVKDRESLTDELLANGYSEESTSYIVNTYCHQGIQTNWDTQTKRICQKYTF